MSFLKMNTCLSELIRSRRSVSFYITTNSPRRRLLDDISSARLALVRVSFFLPVSVCADDYDTIGAVALNMCIETLWAKRGKLQFNISTLDNGHS